MRTLLLALAAVPGTTGPEDLRSADRDWFEPVLRYNGLGIDP